MWYYGWTYRIKRLFKLVLDENKKYNKKYFVSIINKIRAGTNLEQDEQKDFLDLLNDPKVIEVAEVIINRITWITIEEIKSFLKKYPINSIVETLKEKSKLRIINNLSVYIDDYFKNNTYILVYMYKDWEKKYSIIKNEDINNISENIFIFDSCKLVEFDWKMYIYWNIGDKNGYVLLWDEKLINEYFIKWDVTNLKKDKKWVYFEKKSFLRKKIYID